MLWDMPWDKLKKRGLEEVGQKDLNVKAFAFLDMVHKVSDFGLPSQQLVCII